MVNEKKMMFMKTWLFFALTACMIVPSAAFGGPLPAVVDTKWLENHIADPNLVIVDVRNSEDYKSGHVPGAVNIAYSTYMVKKDGLSDQMPENAVVADLLRTAGIDAGSQIVVLGKAGNIGPEVGRVTRFLFTLAYAGVNDTALLDGGMEKWTKEERPMDTQIVQPRPSGFQPEWKHALFADKASVAVASEKSVALCDFRPKGFFTGEKIKKPEVLRPGHLPGAIEVQVEGLMNQENVVMGLGGFWTFKPVAEFRQIIESSLGASREKNVISYCNTGVLSTLGWFVLNRMLGYTNIRMYDGSLEEWTQDPSALVEK